MKQKHYAYRVYRNTIGHPVYGGTVTAFDMDSATDKVIASCKIEVVHEKDTHFNKTLHYFMLNGQKVGILIYANPEDY